MRQLTRRYPYFLIGVFVILMLVAIVLNDGANGARQPASATRYVMEPRGPNPKILYPPPRDFQNLGSVLERRKARQEIALNKYRMVSRSYLRWRVRNETPGTTIIRQPVRFRCKATNVVMPANWCWYANAVRWTEKEIAETGRRMLAARTLPDTDDWYSAAQAVQRVYPGTESWLLGCSGAEGKHGEWVWWRGRPWTGRHIGNDPWGDDTVGGWMQFRYSTFIVYWPSVQADLRKRGVLIPDLGWARPYVVAGASTGYGPWLSSLGQALTAAYMRYTGRDAHHWSASHGRGC